jgi:translation initiation factor 2B subunit (eIF-2B alpha/beta/delta family)
MRATATRILAALRLEGVERGAFMHEEAAAAVESLANDSTSGATAIVLRAADLVLAAIPRAEAPDVAAACARAQPSMAGLIALEALVRGEGPHHDAVSRFRERVRRAPEAIGRQASGVLLLGIEGDGGRNPAMRLVTCSSSAAVEATVRIVSRSARVTLCCAESRPKLEGRELARRLAADSIDVELFSDAAITSALDGAAAVLVGADAVTPEFLINKVGTAGLCAMASLRGVPVYALAGREKVLSEEAARRLRHADAAAAEVWPDPPPAVRVRNPYFEQIPASLITLLITDSGQLVM